MTKPSLTEALESLEQFAFDVNRPPWVSIEGDKILVSGIYYASYALETGIACATTVNGLMTAIKNATRDDINLRLEDGKLVVECDGYSACVKALSDVAPGHVQFETKSAMLSREGALQDAFSRALRCVGKAVMNTSYAALHFGGGYVSATDGRMCCRIQVGGTLETVLDADFATRVSRLKSDVVTMCTNDKQCQFTGDAWRVIGPQSTATNISAMIGQVLEKRSLDEASVTIPVDEFKRALHSARAFDESDRCMIQVGDNAVVVKNADDSEARFTVRIDCQTKGNALVKMNPRYVLAVLGAVENGDTAEMLVSQEEFKLRILSPIGDGLVMGMRG